MSLSSTTSALEVKRTAGRPPLTLVQLDGAQPTAGAAQWARENRDALLEAVREHGSLLVRGLGLTDADEVTAVFRGVSPTLMAEQEAFATRKVYADGVYSSTKWPPNQQMCMHHELSYRLEFPQMLLFACLTAPTSGGATAVADSPTLLRSLPDDLVQRFERLGWQLVRNYNDDIGASYAETFGTEERAAVERYCRDNAIDVAWQPDGGLRTRQRRSAVVRHPVSGERCWFNQVAFLSEWTIAPEIRDYLVDEYGPDGLPFNTRYGNGEPIEPEVVELLNAAYDEVTVREPWQAGDLLLVDNVRTAHSREPFQGTREVLVALADPVRLSDCSPTVEVWVR